MKKHITLLVIITFSHLAIGQNDFRSNSGKRNLHLDKKLSENIEYVSNLKIESNTVKLRSAQIERIVSNYQDDRKSMQYTTMMSRGALEIPRVMLNGALLVAAPETGGASLLLVAGVNTFYNELTDYAIEEITGLGEESVRKNLKTKLDEYQNRFGEEDYTKLLNKNDEQAFKVELENRLGFLFDDSFNDVAAEDRGVILEFYNQEIANVMKDGFVSLEKVQRLQDDEIEQNSEKIKDVAVSLKRYAKKTTAQIVVLTKNQKEIQEGLESINDRQNKTEGDVKFIQEFLFSSMSPKEQLIALNKGFFKGELSTTEKDRLEQKIKLVEQRLELEENISGFLNSGAEVLKIAQDLGLSGKTMDLASDIIKGGQGAYNAFQSLASVPPNYLGAMSTITGIFAKKRDAGAERHKQVMKMLGKIYNKLGLMDKKLDLLLKGQEKLLDNQKKIFEAIINLSEQVERNQIETITRLQEIQRDVLYNRILIREDIEKKYQNCLSVLYSHDGKEKYIDTQEGMYPTSDQIDILYETFSLEISNCWDALTGILAAKKFSAQKFWLESYEKKDSEIKTYINTVYEPARILLFDIDKKYITQDRDEMISSLFFPVGNVQSLNGKKGVHFIGWEENFPNIFFDPFSELMKIPLSPDAVKHHVELILDLHYFDMIFDGTNNYRPFSEKVILDKIDFNHKGKIKLQRALSLVNTSIAQQSLLMGDVLLYNISNIFDAFHRNPSDPEILAYYKMAIKLMENNYVLAHNFVLFKLRNEVSSFSSYGIALKAKPKDFGTSADFELKNVTSYPWNYHFASSASGEDNKPQGWSVSLGKRFVELPSAESLSRGEFIYQPDLIALAKLKERLISEITTYTIYDHISKEDRLILNDLIISSN